MQNEFIFPIHTWTNYAAVILSTENVCVWKLYLCTWNKVVHGISPSFNWWMHSRCCSVNSTRLLSFVPQKSLQASIKKLQWRHNLRDIQLVWKPIPVANDYAVTKPSRFHTKGHNINQKRWRRQQKSLSVFVSFYRSHSLPRASLKAREAIAPLNAGAADWHDESGEIAGAFDHLSHSL